MKPSRCIRQPKWMTRVVECLVAGRDPIWVKIADFEASKRSTHMSLRTVCGTSGYFAPERLGLLPANMFNSRWCFSHALDLWSLGCLVHQPTKWYIERKGLICTLVAGRDKRDRITRQWNNWLTSSLSRKSSATVRLHVSHLLPFTYVVLFTRSYLFVSGYLYPTMLYVVYWNLTAS